MTRHTRGDLMHVDRQTLPRDLAEAALSGAVSFAWYALPDAVPSRRARGVAKVALTVPMAAVGVVQARRAAASPGTEEGAAAARDVLAQVRRSGTARAVAAGAGLLAVAVTGPVAAERAVYRYGQRLGARGVARPHTRIGVVAGVATVALSLATAGLPDPRRPAS